MDDENSQARSEQSEQSEQFSRITLYEGGSRRLCRKTVRTVQNYSEGRFRAALAALRTELFGMLREKRANSAVRR